MCNGYSLIFDIYTGNHIVTLPSCESNVIFTTQEIIKEYYGDYRTKKTYWPFIAYPKPTSEFKILDWESELGKRIRTNYAEMGELSVVEGDIRVVAESMQNRVESKRFPTSEMFTPAQYNAVATLEYRLGPLGNYDRLKNGTEANQYFKANEKEYLAQLIIMIEVNYKLMNNLPYTRISCKGVYYVSDQLPRDFRDGEEGLKNVTGCIENNIVLARVSGVWALKN